MPNSDPRPSAGPTSARGVVSPRPAPGQALLETAIGVVLLLLLSFSILDAAMLFYAYLTLQNAVAEATRYAVTGQEPNPTQHEDAIKRIIHDATPGITIDPVNDIHFYNVTKQTPGTGEPKDVIQVRIDHPWQLISPLLWPLVGNRGRITLHVSATMKNEPPPTG